MRSPSDAAPAVGSPQRRRSRRQGDRTWRTFVGELLIWSTIGLCAVLVPAFFAFLGGEPWHFASNSADQEQRTVLDGGGSGYTSFAIVGTGFGCLIGVFAGLLRSRRVRNRTTPSDSASTSAEADRR